VSRVTSRTTRRLANTRGTNAVRTKCQAENAGQRGRSTRDLHQVPTKERGAARPADDASPAGLGARGKAPVRKDVDRHLAKKNTPSRQHHRRSRERVPPRSVPRQQASVREAARLAICTKCQGENAVQRGRPTRRRRPPSVREVAPRSAKTSTRKKTRAPSRKHLRRREEGVAAGKCKQQQLAVPIKNRKVSVF